MEGSNSLAEETKPWLASSAKPEVQKAKQMAYEMGSGKIQVVYNSTTEQEEQPKLLPQVIASICVAAFHIVVGISMAFSAVLVPQLDEGVGGLQISKASSSWLVSILVLMAPVGAIVSGVMMEYVGRLNTIRFAALPASVGFILIASGQSYGVLFAGRFIAGIASAMGTSPAVVYITEVGSPNVRGSLISMCPTLASLGMLLTYSEGYFFTWRTVAWVTLGYIILSVLVITVWIPESPVWLVARGRVDEAERSLKWLAGKNSRLPERQLAMMVKSQDMKALVVAGFMERLKTFVRPTGYKPMAVICGLFFFQQFSGIYSTLFYAVTFFEDIGSGLDPALATVLMGLVRCLMSMCNTGMLKRFGRRPLCIVSGCGMAACLSVSGIFTWKIVNEGMQGVSWVPVTCILLYVVTSMLGLLSIPWTMTAEMFPTDIRGIAQGIALSVANLLMFLTIQSYISFQELLGGPAQIQWFYASMALCGSLYVFLFLPETHNKKLIDIENYFKTNWMYVLPLKKAKNENVIA